MAEFVAVPDGGTTDAPIMTSVIKICGKCGAKIFADAPQEYCSACLLETGLGLLVEETDGAADAAPALSGSVAARSVRTLTDFGDYQLLEEIGRGGQGVVYRARQKSLNRTVALKVIGLGHWATEAHLKRFRLEAEAAAHLDDPRIVPIYEIGEREGACYFSMKFIEGGQLDKIIGSELMPLRKAAELMAKLARTLHYAHQHGVLHRDVKPGNILLDAKGEPHLTDFGLARLVETESTVTRTMEVLGTPSYMAPEQAVGNNAAITSATDVYGLGAVLYQLLTGHPPFAGGTTYETVRLVLETEPRQPRLWNPKVNRDVATICLKCLEKEPAKRYASAQALAEDLERFLRNEPIRSRRISRFERVWRWCKRKPLIASLTAALIMAVTVGFAGVFWELRRVQEEQALLRRANLSPQEKGRLEAKRSNNPAAYEAYLRGRALAGEKGNGYASPVEDVIQSYQQAVKLDPNFALAWAYLSCVQSGNYWQRDDPAALAVAKDALDQALALDPDLPETHLALGYYRYFGQRDFAGALAEFRQAEQGLPNDVDVIKAISFAQRRLGHWDEAIAVGRRVIELDPRNIDAYINLAITYEFLRRFPEALATLDRLLAFEPANGSVLLRKAHLLWAMGDLQAVEPLLANPGIEPHVRGVQALFQRRYADAKDMLSRAVAAETDPEESEKIKLLLGLSQQRAGDIAAARATYQSAVQDFQRRLKKVAPRPEHEGEARAGLGRAYAGLGEAAPAIAEGQKAMALTSKDLFEGPKKQGNMAEIYALLGDADHAIPILKRLLQIPYSGTITPALLRLDPVWDPIRNDPRFQELAAEK